MNNDNNGSDKHDFQTIKPAELNLTRDSSDSGAGKRTAAARVLINTRPGFVLLLLVAAVIGVIFFLPDWVEPVPDSAVSGKSGGQAAPPAEDTPAKGNKSGEQSGEPAPAATPWSDAQLARLRKQSQDLLSDMLEAQETLKEHQVRQWAGDEFDRALETAEQGDTAYRERRFGEAVDLYRQAFDRFSALVDSMDRVYNQAMERGRQALAGGNAEKAAASFDRALLIRPGDEAARRGKQRAGTLDEVNALVAEGVAALEQDQLQEAKSKFSRALEIDPYSDRAKQRLQETDKLIRNRDFRQAMSNGYTALEQGRLEQAWEAFSAAQKLKPGSGEAGDALALVRETVKTRSISQHLDAAQLAVSGEEWRSAIDHYQQALSLDSSLAEAQAGLQRARRRNDLDQRLEQAIANPERLWDDAVQEETRQLLQQARDIQPAGPKLSRQITSLEQLLEKVSTPVTVQLHSDNQTSVTIYKVGEMGKFSEKAVTLMPGRYVAVGTRPGYRDVRVEFTVRSGKDLAPVVIETTEKINL